jgi:hypothetical protein
MYFQYRLVSKGLLVLAGLLLAFSLYSNGWGARLLLCLVAAFAAWTGLRGLRSYVMTVRYGGRDKRQTPLARRGFDPDAVEKAVACLPLGQAAVDAPTKMRVGQTKRVSVTIATATHAEFQNTLVSVGAIRRIQETKVAPAMRVELSGPEFDVNPVGAIDRLFGGRETWLFDITAQSAGKQTLTVLIAVRLTLPGLAEDEPFYASVADVEIHVRVSYLRTLKHFLQENGGKAVMAGLGFAVGHVIHLSPVRNAVIALYNSVLGAHLGMVLPLDE